MSSSVTTVGVLVDRILASSLVTGSIAALNYSQVLSQLPTAVLLQSFAQPVFTRLSAHWNAVQRDEYDDLLARGFVLVAAVALPVTLTFLWLGSPLLAAIYEHGHYSLHSRALTLGPLMGWAVGIPAAGYGTYLSRALFAQRKTRVITWISLSTVALNIAGDLLLIHPLKATGLALATSIAWWLRAGLLALFLRKSLGSFSRPLIRATQFGWLVCAMLLFSALEWALPDLLGITPLSRGWALIIRLAFILVVSWAAYLAALIKLPILDPRDRRRLSRGFTRLRQTGGR
jgi:putative peptidoglycan lipid II flippase